MTVAKILNDKGSAVHTILSDVTVEDATRQMRELRVGALVATNEGDEIAGVFSERDLVRAITTDGQSALGRPISAYMTRGVITVALTDTIDHVMEMMTDRRVRHLPVVDGGRLSGIISIGDVVKVRMAETEFEAQALKEYISAG